jgi:hypothetical protein
MSKNSIVLHNNTSIKEQLQIEIGKIMTKLGTNELSYKKCYDTISKLFEDPDVKEDETITSYYKKSWLDALEDYKPIEGEELKEEII